MSEPTTEELLKETERLHQQFAIRSGDVAVVLAHMLRVSGALRKRGHDHGRSETKEWRCFYCDEVFRDEAAARLHFGTSNDAICQLNAMEGGLVKLVRDQEDELQEFRSQERESNKEFYRLGAAHSVALRREEEKGYAYGLADGLALKHPTQDKHPVAERAPSDPPLTLIQVTAYYNGLRYTDFKTPAEFAKALGLKLEAAP